MKLSFNTLLFGQFSLGVFRMNVYICVLEWWAQTRGLKSQKLRTRVIGWRRHCMTLSTLRGLGIRRYMISLFVLMGMHTCSHWEGIVCLCCGLCWSPHLHWFAGGSDLFGHGLSRARVEMMYLGCRVHFFLGFEVWQTHKDISISQQNYTNKIRLRFQMVGCRSVSTLMDPKWEVILLRYFSKD